MSKILVDTIDTRSGTTTLTLGSTNAGTIALGSGDVQSNFLYPAFHAKLSSAQTLVYNTATKIQFNTEVFDTDSAYDNSSNYRFTVPSGKAGKYFIYYQLRASSLGTTWQFGRVQVYKNGSAFSDNAQNNGSSALHSSNFFNGTLTLDLSASDYLEIYYTHESSDNSNGTATVGSPGEQGVFGAYRIGT
jgi:hypothetical protein